MWTQKIFKLFICAAPTLLFLFLNSSFTFDYKPNKTLKLLTGQTWHYSSVIQSGKEVFKIGSSDTMKLTDTSFSYFIEQPGKKAMGDFDLIKVSKDSSPIEAALKFTYYPVKNTRIFCIQKLNKKILVIKENDLVFSYKR